MDQSWLLLLLLIGVCGSAQSEKLPRQNFEGSASNHRQQPIPRPGIRVLDSNAVADIIGTPASAARALRRTDNGVPPPYLLQPSPSTAPAFQTSAFPTLKNNNNKNNNNFNQFNSNNNINVGHLSNLQNHKFTSNIPNNNNNGFRDFNTKRQANSNGFSNPNNQVSNFYQQFINNKENEIIRQSGNSFPFSNGNNQRFKQNFQYNLASHEDVHTDTDALNGVSFLSNDGINNFGGTGVILPEPEVINLAPKETIVLDGGNSNSKNFGLPNISPAIELHPGGNSQRFTIVRDNDDKDSFESFVNQAGSFGLPQIKSENDITANNAFSQQLFTIKNDDDDNDDDSFENFGIQSGGFVGPISSVQGNRNSFLVPGPLPGPIPTPVQGNSGSFADLNLAPVLVPALQSFTESKQSNPTNVQVNSGSFVESNPAPIQGNSGSFVESNPVPVQGNSGSFVESNPAPIQGNSGSFVESNPAPVQGNSGSFVDSNPSNVQGNSGSFIQSKESNPAPTQGSSGSFSQSKESNPTPIQGNSGSFSQSNSSPINGNKESGGKDSTQVTEKNKSFEDNLKTESSNSRNQFGIPLPALVPTGSSEKQDNIQVDSVVNALTSISSGKAGNIDNAFGGMTIGQLLNGINGKNGIVVLPASKANSLNLPNLGNKISIRETSDEQIVVETSSTVTASSTTTEAPVTRRRSNRRTTTRPPDHLRRSLSDILYAKGQWFGTLLGGVIDYGRIAYDSFNKNLGKGSRESYA